MITDKVADLLTRIRNAQRAGFKTVQCPASNFLMSILTVMKEEGYIVDYQLKAKQSKQSKTKKDELKDLNIELRYSNNGAPVIKEIKRLSKPGKRVFVGCDDIPTCRGGLGTVIVSTSKGVVSDTEARNSKSGGELICSIF